MTTTSPEKTRGAGLRGTLWQLLEIAAYVVVSGALAAGLAFVFTIALRHA